MAAAAIGLEVIFTTASATMASVAGSSSVASRRALTFGTGAAAGGLVITIAADGPMSTATLPTAATSSVAVNDQVNTLSTFKPNLARCDAPEEIGLLMRATYLPAPPRVFGVALQAI